MVTTDDLWPPNILSIGTWQGDVVAAMDATRSADFRV